MGVLRAIGHYVLRPLRKSKQTENDFPIDAWTDDVYPQWFEKHRSTPEQVAQQRAALSAFAYQPLFSLIVPLYKTPIEYLHTMVDSVLGQSYSRFQLVLVNASPENTSLRQEIERYAAEDERITVVTLEENLGITENTNRGIEAANGDFYGFLDHDDFIEPDLLFSYAEALNKDPAIDILYCDEDMVIWDGKKYAFEHVHPLFKPAYSPELLLCKNYVVHLMCIRAKLVKDMPRPDARYEGSQDYNMLLRCANKARVVHGVQRVLYHWRIHEQSTATNPESKPYTIQSCRLAIQQHYERLSLPAGIIESGIYDLYNPWFSRRSQSVSLIVNCHQDIKMTERFLQFFNQINEHEDSEIILVGTDESFSFTKEAYPCPIKQIYCKDHGLFAQLNAGAQVAASSHLLFLDAGCTFATPMPLTQLLGMLSADVVGCVGPKLLYADGICKSFGVGLTRKGVFPLFRGYDDDFPAYQCFARCFLNVSALGWQGLCTRADLFTLLGGFDEQFEGEIGAVDYCLRAAQRSYRTVVMDTVKVKVEEQLAQPRYNCRLNAADYTARDLVLFDTKWPHLRQRGDKYLNANLDPGSEYFQIPHSE